MNYWCYFAMLLISIFSSVVLGKIFDKSNKKDKGFVFCYWKLSYRRKFFRTLWMLPLLVVVLIINHNVYSSIFLKCTIASVLLLSFMIQAIYTYKKWKAETN